MQTIEDEADIGCQTYYQNKIEAAELEITKKTQNLRRLEAQRNALNTRGALGEACRGQNIADGCA